jgi:hypothetical protein
LFCHITKTREVCEEKSSVKTFIQVTVCLDTSRFNGVGVTNTGMACDLIRIANDLHFIDGLGKNR